MVISCTRVDCDERYRGKLIGLRDFMSFGIKDGFGRGEYSKRF